MTRPTSPHPAWVLILDLGLPVAGYYAARLLGTEGYLALMIGVGLALFRLIWVATRSRRRDSIAGFTAAVLVAGLIISSVSGDARWMLLKDSFVTGAAGIAVVVSALMGRSLVLTAVRSTASQPRRREIDEQLGSSAPFRRSFSVMTIVWGAGLVAEAVVRIPLVYTVSVDVMVAVSQALFLGTIALLAGWTMWYSRRVERLSAQTDS